MDSPVRRIVVSPATMAVLFLSTVGHAAVITVSPYGSPSMVPHTSWYHYPSSTRRAFQRPVVGVLDLPRENTWEPVPTVFVDDQLYKRQHSPKSGSNDHNGLKQGFDQEFDGIFAGIKSLPDQFTAASRLRPAMKSGLALPSIMTPSPTITMEKRHSSTTTTNTPESGINEHDSLALEFAQEFDGFFAGVKNLPSQFTAASKLRPAMKSGLAFPSVVTPSPVITMKKREPSITATPSKKKAKNAPGDQYRNVMKAYGDLKERIGEKNREQQAAGKTVDGYSIHKVFQDGELKKRQYWQPARPYNYPPSYPPSYPPNYGYPGYAQEGYPDYVYPGYDQDGYPVEHDSADDSTAKAQVPEMEPAGPSESEIAAASYLQNFQSMLKGFGADLGLKDPVATVHVDTTSITSQEILDQTTTDEFTEEPTPTPTQLDIGQIGDRLMNYQGLGGATLGDSNSNIFNANLADSKAADSTVGRRSVSSCADLDFDPSDATCFNDLLGNERLCPVKDNVRTIVCGDMCADPASAICASEIRLKERDVVMKRDEEARKQVAVCGGKLYNPMKYSCRRHPDKPSRFQLCPLSQPLRCYDPSFFDCNEDDGCFEINPLVDAFGFAPLFQPQGSPSAKSKEEADSGVSTVVITDTITLKNTVIVPEKTVTCVTCVMPDATGVFVKRSSAISEEEITCTVTVPRPDTTKYETTMVPTMTVEVASHRCGHFVTRTLVKRSRNRKDHKSPRPTLTVPEVPRFTRLPKDSQHAPKGSKGSPKDSKGSPKGSPKILPPAPKTPKIPKWQSWPKWNERHPMINTPGYYNETLYNDTHHGDTRYNLTVSVNSLLNQTWHNVTWHSPRRDPRWTNSSEPAVAVHFPISPGSLIANYSIQGDDKSLRNSSYGFSQNQTESKPNQTEIRRPLPGAPTLTHKPYPPYPTFEIAEDDWEGTTPAWNLWPSDDESGDEGDGESDGEYDSDEDEEIVDTVYIWGGTGKDGEDAKAATLNPSPAHNEKKEPSVAGALQQQQDGRTKEALVKDVMDHIDDILEGIPFGGAHEEISESEDRPGWAAEFHLMSMYQIEEIFSRMETPAMNVFTDIALVAANGQVYSMGVSEPAKYCPAHQELAQLRESGRLDCVLQL